MENPEQCWLCLCHVSSFLCLQLWTCARVEVKCCQRIQRLPHVRWILCCQHWKEITPSEFIPSVIPSANIAIPQARGKVDFFFYCFRTHIKDRIRAGLNFWGLQADYNTGLLQSTGLPHWCNTYSREKLPSIWEKGEKMESGCHLLCCLEKLRQTQKLALRYWGKQNKPFGVTGSHLLRGQHGIAAKGLAPAPVSLGWPLSSFEIFSKLPNLSVLNFFIYKMG